MIVVIVLGAGAGWEPQALAAFAADPGIAVLKRCVDVDDLLACASTGQAEVAVVGVEAPGLDRTVVDALAAEDVRVVAVAPDVDGVRGRAARIGLDTLVPADRPAALVEAVRQDEPPTAPHPAAQEPARDAASEPPAPAGRVVAVWGATGAPGRTTTAIGLAAQLARRPTPTVLVDADPHGGTVAQHLGVLDEASGLLVAARLAAAGTLAERYAEVPRQLGEHLAVVTGLPRPDRWRELRPGTLEQLVGCARRAADVVLDTGFDLDADPSAEAAGRAARNGLTHEALAVADEVVVVGSADPVGLARLARALRDLAEHLDLSGRQPRVHVVVNRMRSSLGWREREISTLLAGFGAAPVHYLPDDQAALDRALAAGRSPAEAGESALTRAHTALLAAVLPAPAAPVVSR